MFVGNEFMRFHWNAADVINSPWLMPSEFVPCGICSTNPLSMLQLLSLAVSGFFFHSLSMGELLTDENVVCWACLTTLNEPERKKRRKKNDRTENEPAKWKQSMRHRQSSMGTKRRIRLIRLIQDIGVRPKQCIIERLVRHSWTISQSVYQRPYKWSHMLLAPKRKTRKFYH